MTGTTGRVAATPGSPTPTPGPDQVNLLVATGTRARPLTRPWT